MKKSKSKDASPFLNAEETIKYVLQILFLNGDCINAEMFAKSIGIHYELAQEILAESLATHATYTQDEWEKIIDQEIKSIKNPQKL